MTIQPIMIYLITLHIPKHCKLCFSVYEISIAHAILNLSIQSKIKLNANIISLSSKCLQIAKYIKIVFLSLD